MIGGPTAFALLTSARHQALLYALEWRFTVVLGVVQPCVLLLVNLAVVHDPVATSRTVLGVVLMAFWTSTVWNGAGILRLERIEGVLAAGLFSRRPALVVLVGKSLGASLIASVAIAATVAVALIGLGRPLVVAAPAALVLGLVVVFVSGTALGVLLSCVFLVSRFGAQISGLLMYPVFIIGGLLIPAQLLPDGVAALSSVISLHWAMVFLAGCVAGGPDWPALGLAALLTAGYMVAVYRTFTYVSQRARGAGTLDLE